VAGDVVLYGDAQGLDDAAVQICTRFDGYTEHYGTATYQQDGSRHPKYGVSSEHAAAAWRMRV